MLRYSREPRAAHAVWAEALGRGRLLQDLLEAGGCERELETERGRHSCTGSWCRLGADEQACALRERDGEAGHFQGAGRGFRGGSGRGDSCFRVHRGEGSARSPEEGRVFFRR